ncbi:hypothetical protein HDU84_001033 [Entophlyctis sp. JEL0112]|nr:hypothetical protein HDU84_001033 [Entophlyctis sp. JEL0112]
MFAVDTSQGGSPFGSQPMLFTLGLLILLAFCIPLSLKKIDENVMIQVASFLLTLVVGVEWFVESTFTWEKSRVQPFSVTSAFGGLLGPIILNFSCTIFAPTFVNYKAKDVDVQRVIWTTMLIAVVFFGVVGVFPALAFDGLAVMDASSPTVNVITLFTNPMVAAHPIVNKAFCYMFSIVMLLPAIPVSCLVSQENIEQNFRLSQYGGTGKWILRIVCYALPWIVSIPLLTGNGLATFMNWTGVLCVLPANFILPFLIYLKCVAFRKVYNEKRTLTSKQTSILKNIHHHSSTIVSYLDSEQNFKFAASKDKEPFLSQFNRRKPNLPEIGTGLKLIPDPTQMSPTAEGGQQSVRLNFDSFVRRLGFGSKQREDNEFHIPLPPLVSQNTQKYGTVGGEDNGESTISLSVESAETLQVSIPAIAISSENGAGAEPGDTTDIGTERGTPEEPTRQASDEFWLQEAVPDPLLERPETTVGGASLQRLLGNATLTMQRLTTPMRKRSFGTFPPHESPTVNDSSMDGDEHAVAIPSSKPGTLIVDEDFTHLSVVAHDDYGLLDLAGMPLTGSADTRRENSRLRHLGTLMPIHKDFVAKTAFCAVPYWIPVSGPVIAKVLLVVSVLLVVLVVVLQIVSAVQ